MLGVIGVEDRVTFRRADCFGALDEGPLGSFDVIVSNPPYLEDAEIAAIEPDVRNFEPRDALSAGSGGLDIVRKIISGAAAHLAHDGELIMEDGAGQAAAVVRLVGEAGLSAVAVINDFAGMSASCRREEVGRNSEWKK